MPWTGGAGGETRCLSSLSSAPMPCRSTAGLPVPPPATTAESWTSLGFRRSFPPPLAPAASLICCVHELSIGAFMSLMARAQVTMVIYPASAEGTASICPSTEATHSEYALPAEERKAQSQRPSGCCALLGCAEGSCQRASSPYLHIHLGPPALAISISNRALPAVLGGQKCRCPDAKTSCRRRCPSVCSSSGSMALATCVA